MRVSVQGCLILLLCLCSFNWAYASDPVYEKSEIIDCALNDQGVRDCNYKRFSDGRSANQIVADRAEDHRSACLAVASFCSVEVIQTDGNLHAIGTMYGYETDPCDAWSHEGIQDTECGTCKAGYIQVEGTGYQAPFQCMLNREPGECSAIGKAEAQTSEGAFCVEECEHGMLNGVCLPPPEPEKECTKDSPDYRGV